MNKDTVKAKAKALQSFMLQQGVPLKYSAALEAVARVEGAPSYNVLQSRVEKAPPATFAAPAEDTWDIDVCRVGYSRSDVTVKGARSYKEAEKRALEEIDSDSFGTEYASDYFIDGTSDPADEATPVIDEPMGPMADWAVVICRKSYGTKTLKIKRSGQTLEEARELALDEAGNHYYSAQYHEYEVTAAFPLSWNPN